MAARHSHNHSHSAVGARPEEQARKTLIFSVFGTLLLVALKMTVGIVGQSEAVLADAIESCGDVISTVLLIIAFSYSRKPADQRHPYGHGKIEPLASFIVVLLLVGAAFIIGFRSVTGIFYSDGNVPKTFTLYFLIGVILYKETMYQIIISKANKLNSSAMRADAWHHRSDAITSLAALIGVGIAVIGGPKYASADSWAALLGCIVILYNAYKMFIPIVGEILDENSYPELEKEIFDISRSVEGVIYVEKAFIRKSGLKYLVDMHLIVDGNISVLEGHYISHVVKDKIMAEKDDVQDVLIHIEPNHVKL